MLGNLTSNSAPGMAVFYRKVSRYGVCGLSLPPAASSEKVEQACQNTYTTDRPKRS